MQKQQVCGLRSDLSALTVERSHVGVPAVEGLLSSSGFALIGYRHQYSPAGLLSDVLITPAGASLDVFLSRPFRHALVVAQFSALCKGSFETRVEIRGRRQHAGQARRSLEREPLSNQRA